MGTTTTHDLPYPDPTDRARNGSVAVRSLAEAVDALLAHMFQPAYAISPGPGPSQSGIGPGGALADFAPIAAGAAFTMPDDSTVVYTGPDRDFMMSFEAEATLAGDVATNVVANLTHTGAGGASVIGVASLALQAGGGGTIAGQTTLRIATVGRLSAGDALQLGISGTAPGAIFDRKQFRIYPIGPAA